MRSHKLTRVATAVALLLGGTVAAGSTAGAEPAPPPDGITIAASTTTPQENQAVNLIINTSDILASTSAHWTFGDGTEADGISVTHQWATARSTPYRVTVTAITAGGEQHTKSIDIAVRATLGVIIQRGDETITVDSADTIHCPEVCSGAYAVGAQVTLTAKTTVGRLLGHWDGACASAGVNTCVVTVDATKTVTFTVEKHLVDLTVHRMTPAVLGSFVVTVAGDAVGERFCPSTCTYAVPYNSQIKITGEGVPGDTQWESGVAIAHPSPIILLTIVVS